MFLWRTEGLELSSWPSCWSYCGLRDFVINSDFLHFLQTYTAGDAGEGEVSRSFAHENLGKFTKIVQTAEPFLLEAYRLSRGFKMSELRVSNGILCYDQDFCVNTVGKILTMLSVLSDSMIPV